MKEKKIVFNVNVPAPAVEKLRDFCGERLIQKAVLGDLITWFTHQPGPVQKVVMGDVTEGMEEDYARALETLAAKVRASAKKRGQ